MIITTIAFKGEEMITTAEIAQTGANMIHDGHNLDQVTEKIRNMVPATSLEGMEKQTRHVLSYMFKLLSEKYND